MRTSPSRSQGSLRYYPHGGPPCTGQTVHGCQVFVAFNVACTCTDYVPVSGSSGIGNASFDIAVEPPNNLSGFQTLEGPTGFSGSYNVNTAPPPYVGPNGFEEYNVPGTPNTVPFIQTWLSEDDEQNVPVVGCSGAPYGMIYNPGGTPYNESMTLTLAYTACPGTPANDQGGGGGGTSDDDDDGDMTWATASPWSGPWPPCPANQSGCGGDDSNDSGIISVSGTSQVDTSVCAACFVLSNDSFPITFGDHGELNASLEAGTYTWSAQFTDPATTLFKGTAEVTVGNNTSVVADVDRTQAVTFDETGLPAGESWSVWANGSTETSTSGSITLPETNGSVPYFILGPKGYEGTLGGTGGGTAGSFYGNLTVQGNTTETVSLIKMTDKSSPQSVGTPGAGMVQVTKHIDSASPLYFKSVALSKGSTFCVAVLPAALAAATAGHANDTSWVPGIVQCSDNTSKVTFPSIPWTPASSTSGPTVLSWTTSVPGQSFPSGYLPEVSNGSVNVTNHAVTVKVPFGYHTYSLTFAGTGLVGKRWHERTDRSERPQDHRDDLQRRFAMEHIRQGPERNLRLEEHPDPRLLAALRGELSVGRGRRGRGRQRHRTSHLQHRDLQRDVRRVRAPHRNELER